MNTLSLKSVGLLLIVVTALVFIYGSWRSADPSGVENGSSGRLSVDEGSRNLQSGSSLGNSAINDETSQICVTYQLNPAWCDPDSTALPWKAGNAYVWDAQYVGEAIAILRLYEGFMDGPNGVVADEVQPIIEFEVRNAIARAQRPAGGFSSSAADVERMLASKVQSFRSVLDEMVYLDSYLRDLRFRELQSDLAEHARIFVLASIDDLQDLEQRRRFLQVRPGVNENPQTFAYVLYGLNSQSEVRDYVRSTLEGISKLGNSYALPLVVYLLNTTGAVGNGNVRLWSSTLTELNKVDTNNPQNEVNALQEFLLQYLAFSVPADCDKIADMPDMGTSQSWYAVTYKRVAADLRAACER